MGAAANSVTKESPEFSGRRLRNASFWVFGGYAVGQVLRLASNLIMTRMLAPEMFGVMAVANVVVAAVQMLTDMGIQKSIIQSKSGVQRSFLNTAWAMQILRGISLAGLIFGLALTLWLIGPDLSPSSVYSHPDLPLVLMVLASSLIIGGFRSTKSAVANRTLNMEKLTTIDLGAQVIAIVTMISWASHDPTVWALVAGTLISIIAKVITENIFLPGEGNAWEWKKQHVKEIFHFGKWIFATSLLSYWVLNGDRVILGFDITAGEMGVYSIAIFIVGSVRGALNSIMQKVMYPAMSSALREKRDCISVYYRFRLPLDALICGLCGFLVVAGQIIVDILYDDRYMQAGIFLTYLSVGLLADRYRGLGLYYQAQGKPKKMMIIALSRAALLTIGLPVALYQYGLIGAVIFLGVYPLLIVPLQLYLKHRAGLVQFKLELAYTAFVLPGAAFGYLFIFGASTFIN